MHEHDDGIPIEEPPAGKPRDGIVKAKASNGTATDITQNRSLNELFAARGAGGQKTLLTDQEDRHHARNAAGRQRVRIEANVWDAERLGRLVNLSTHTEVDRLGEYALYIFHSKSKNIIRAGAIGVHRTFSMETAIYSEEGNSVSKRFYQYNRAPGNKAFKRGPNKDRLPKDVFPWCARQFEYIWGVTLTGDVSPPVVLAAESMMHQRMQQSGLRYRGSSCHDCNDNAKAILIAEKSLRMFLKLAPLMFEADAS